MFAWNTKKNCTFPCNGKTCGAYIHFLCLILDWDILSFAVQNDVGAGSDTKRPFARLSARETSAPSLPPPLLSLPPSPPLLPSVWIPFVRTCGILCHCNRLRTLLFFFLLCFFFSLLWRKDQFENWDETTESRVIAF